jgi:hypothetical protein
MEETIVDTTEIIIMLIAALVAAGLVIWFWSRSRQTNQLRERFGPEYDHTVETYGDRREAERALEGRAKRVEGLDIRPLNQDEHDRFSREWIAIQSRFVDDPRGALQDADRVVQDLMSARGYPMGDFEQRAADISVDHPHVVDHYRAAHSTLPAFGKIDPDTEQLRVAMVHYRALFQELLDIPVDSERIYSERAA